MHQQANTEKMYAEWQNLSSDLYFISMDRETKTVNNPGFALCVCVCVCACVLCLYGVLASKAINTCV